MIHTDMEELLSAHANGELARTQSEFVEEHLRSCADCRESLVNNVWVRSRITSLKEAPIEADIAEATMSRIREQATGGRETSRLMRPALVVAAILLAVVVPLAIQLSGTGSGGGIAEAYSAFASLKSYRMTGSTITTSDSATTEVAFDWAFVSPDRYQGRLTESGESREFIIVRDEQYSRTTSGGQTGGTVVVVTSGGFSIFNPLPTRDGTLQILDLLIDVSVLENQQIDGVDSLHYRGMIDMDRVVDEVLADFDSSSPGYAEAAEAFDIQRTAEISVELWFGKEDLFMRRLDMDVRSPGTSSGPDGVRRIVWLTYKTTATYFDFDKPIEVDRPIDASGNLEQGWRLVGGDSAPEPSIEVRTSD
jgi:hypothetical protein